MYLLKVMAAAVVATGLALTACGHVTEASNNPANMASSLPPQADASGQPCNNGLASTAESSLYGVSPEQQTTSQGYVESMYRPVVIQDQPVAPAAVYTPDSGYENQPVYENQPAGNRYYQRGRVQRRHGRSKGKSAAIVLGSAAAGAGIGALAGGGGGAAIGAASGGAAGFIYDRLTHNHH